MLATLRTCLPRQLDKVLRADGHVAAQIAVPITQRLILLYDRVTLSPERCLDQVGNDVSGWTAGGRSFSQHSSGDGNDGSGKKAGKIKDKKQADSASSDATGKLAGKDKKSTAEKAGHAQEGSLKEIYLDDSGEIAKVVDEVTQKVPSGGLTGREGKAAGTVGYNRASFRRNLQEMSEKLVKAEMDMQELEKEIAELDARAGKASEAAAIESGRLRKLREVHLNAKTQVKMLEEIDARLATVAGSDVDKVQKTKELQEISRALDRVKEVQKEAANVNTGVVESVADPIAVEAPAAAAAESVKQPAESATDAAESAEHVSQSLEQGGEGVDGTSPSVPPVVSIVPTGLRPENFPKVLAVPLSRRPLFPGFFVPVSVTGSKLVESLQRLRSQGTPYVGAFLLKEQDPVTTAAAAAAAAAEKEASSSDSGGSGSGIKSGNSKSSSDTSVTDSSSSSSSTVPSSSSIKDSEADHGISNPYPPSSAIPTGLMEELEEDQREKEDGESIWKEVEGGEGKGVGETSAKKGVDGEGGGKTQGLFGTEGEGTPKGKEMLKRMHEVGTFAQIMNVFPRDGGNAANVLLMGHRRIRRTSTVSEDPLIVNVDYLKEEPFNSNSDIIKATVMEVVSSLKELMNHNPLYKEHIAMFIQQVGEFSAPRMADFGAAMTTADEAMLQQVLEELNVDRRLNHTLMLLKKELQLAKLQASIAKGVEEKISSDQRRYLLTEQLKAIKKELGLERDDKTTLITKFQERLEPFKAGCPPAVLQVIEEEVNKLQGLEASSSEFNVTRNYLDWLTSIPWGHHSEESLDVAAAQKVLDADHYGLTDVKERILEFIAVGRLRGSTHGKIICLVGPPGVGKTSIGKSIAHALNRKFFRFSVGGLSDVAEIKGHRRTYIGAMPGKMVQCLKNVQTANPLVLIDEIDKLGRGHTGDPASALLELLDPEQNSAFLDHYLDVPVDLSKVLFVCTANVLDTIPAPLLDRMEVVRLVGYIADEKKHIARGYLEPNARTASGVKGEEAEVTDAALQALIETYCREAGVRSLQKHIERIYRKVALKLVRRQEAEGTAPLSPAPDQASSHAAAAVGEVSILSDTGASGEVLPAMEPNTNTEQAVTVADDSEVVAEMEEGRKGMADAAVVSEGDRSENEDVKGAVGGKEDGEEAGSADGPAAAPEAAAPDAGAPEAVVDKIVVDESNLPEYAGQPVFQNEKFYDHTPVGVVMGLAWTAMGGSTLYVESTIVDESDNKGGLELTGQLGDVMRESASIAHTVARRILLQHQPDNKFFRNTRLHLHVPAGATPKDGPSAGCTMITSLLSLAFDRSVKPDVAMTGEVTLTGRVLPIGGVKEKTIAARRNGVKIIIFPAANKKDFEELPQHVRDGLDVRFVDHYDQIFEIVFEPGPDWNPRKA